jgi:peptidoglycan/LPS O-acetylase OafA/YrhL
VFDLVAFTWGSSVMPSADRTLSRPSTPRALSTLFDPRSNSLNQIRLVLALIVALSHALAIGYDWEPQVGLTELGDLAVDAFFVLSGFLVTRSYLGLRSARRFAWHRALRILPAFWFTLLLTAFVVAPALAALEGRGAWSVLGGGEPSYGYVADNALLLMRSFGVSGLPSGTAVPGVVNGSLWTLYFEAVCYVGTGVLGVLGLLRRRALVLPFAVLALAGLVVQAAGVEAALGEYYLRFGFLFLLGTLGNLYGDRIVLRRRYLMLALTATGGSLAVLDDYRLTGAVPFAYLCLYAVVATPFLRRGLKDDLSYGVYVYHWPVAALLVTGGALSLGPAPYLLLTLGIVVLLALASWRWLERPALSAKNAFADRTDRGGWRRSRVAGEPVRKDADELVDHAHVAS